MNTIACCTGSDEIVFRLVAQRTIIQDDVRVSVPVTALISTATSGGDDLDRRIRAALSRLIDAPWVFSLIQRDGEAVGFERVNLTAWARVPHAQVFNLGERARWASEEGLSLGTPNVDYSLPATKLNEVAHELRGELLTQIRAQLTDYERWTGRPWRIGEVVLGSSVDRSERRTRKGLTRSEDDLQVKLDVRHLGAGSNASVVGAERVRLIADVTLRSAPKEDALG